MSEPQHAEVRHLCNFLRNLAVQVVVLDLEGLSRRCLSTTISSKLEIAHVCSSLATAATRTLKCLSDLGIFFTHFPIVPVSSLKLRSSSRR